MKITFDKGTSSEKSLEVGTVGERLTENRLAGYSNIQIRGPEDFPEIEGFETGLAFSTVEIVSGDMIVPLYGTYNKILSFSTQYSDDTGIFTLSIALGLEQDAEATA